MYNDEQIMDALDRLSTDIIGDFDVCVDFGKADTEFESETGVGFFIEIFSRSPLGEESAFDSILDKVLTVEDTCRTKISVLTHTYINTMKYYPERAGTAFVYRICTAKSDVWISGVDLLVTAKTAANESLALAA